MPAKMKDMTGEQIGKLKVIKLARHNKHGNIMWLCECECGKEKEICGSDLRSGRVVSCGCHRNKIAKVPKKHGKCKTREYKIWCYIITRCTNSKIKHSNRYSGRGIKICERWRHSFDNFLADMGPCPSPKHSIDRINNDGDYSPDNCRWATTKEQANNKSDNRLITHNGETKTASEWAESVGINVHTFLSRIDKFGWSVDEALGHKPGALYKKAIIVTHKGESKTLSEWSETTGIPRGTIYDRIFRNGWSIEKALETPVDEKLAYNRKSK